jgi:hypothetical protein
MGVSEARAGLGEPIEVGRRDFGLGVIAAYVAVAQVIDEDDDDVGTTKVRGCFGECGKKPAETEQEQTVHFSRTQILR